MGSGTRPLAALDAGDERTALVGLLRDQDDWAPDPPPDRNSLGTLLNGSPTLREAMDSLGFGPVSDYFTYRLSDPTYLAGLALMAAHWNVPRVSFELACGIGHYSRELSRRGVGTIAGDVVFAKLWLARRYVTPKTRLVCFDAAAPFPLEDGSADLALCHDAFYFLPEKEHVGAELMRLAGSGKVLVGHRHNAAVENHSSGDPLPRGRLRRALPQPASLRRLGTNGVFPERNGAKTPGAWWHSPIARPSGSLRETATWNHRPTSPCRRPVLRSFRTRFMRSGGRIQ